MDSIEQKKPAELLRRLGLITAISYAMGSMIGSGIFKKPGIMAVQLGSPELLVLVWIITGVMTLFGALSIAEIAGMIHEPGGQYIFFNKSYNRFMGYLYGWAVFIVIQTGSIASMAYVFSDSFSYFIQLPRFDPATENFALNLPFIGAIFPLKFIGLKLVTIGLIIFLSTINYIGVQLGSVVQVIVTSIKVFAIIAIVAFAFTVGNGNFNHFSQSVMPIDTGNTSIFLGIIMAMSGAFWAYDGWINVTYLAGEVKNPQKNLPRSLFFAVLIVMIVYILVNLAYIYVIPVGEMAAKYKMAETAGGSYLVATDVTSSLWEGKGGIIIAIAIMVSTFGAVNGTIMMSARVHYAMSKEGLFFKKIKFVHPRFKTPTNALLFQGIWATIMVFSGTFDQLTDMIIFVSWVFYGMAAFGVFMLRKRWPDVERPYKVWGYPVVPVLFVFFAFVYVVFTLYSDINSFVKGESPLINSLMGVILIAIGIPGYLYWNKKNPVKETNTP
jgi:basic amino acid/polyamine antiporter, APA family